MIATSTAALIVPFVLQADLQGRLYRGECDRETIEPMLAAPPSSDAVMLSAGDLLGPGPEARFAVEQGAAGRRALSEVLAGSLDAILPGNFELSIDRDVLGALTNEARLPWIITNLSPRFPTLPERMIERAGVKIGITGAIHDDLGVHLSHLTHDEQRVEAAPALVASIRRLREAGARIVVALVHVTPKRGTTEVVRLVEALGADRPDLLFTSGMAGDVRSLSVGDLSVVPAPGQGAAIVEVALTAGGPRVVAIERSAPAPQADARLEALRRSNCSELGQRLAPLDAPLERDAFIQYVLEVMRRDAQAEIAIVNTGAFGGSFPLHDAVTRLALMRAIRVDDGLKTTFIRGSDLAKLVPLLSNEAAAVLGLDAKKVVGRDVDPTRRYRVVTVDFVAMGGDALLPAGLGFAPLDGGTLRERVVQHLAEHGASIVSEPPALLGATLTIAGNVKTVTVQNNARYAEPQLARNAFLGVGALAELRLYADFERHKVELLGRSRYGIAKDGTDRALENDDLTIGELSYLGRFAARGHAFWIPDASAAVGIETELTKPDERSFRRALLTGGAGPSWPLTDRISLRVQLGVRRELLARSDSPDPSEAEVAQTKLALLTTLEMLRLDFPTDNGAPALVTLRIDHALELTGVVRDNALRGRLDVDLPITSVLAVTAGLEAYVLHRLEPGADRQAGVAYDTTLGLKTSGDLGLVVF